MPGSAVWKSAVKDSCVRNFFTLLIQEQRIRGLRWLRQGATLFESHALVAGAVNFNFWRKL